MYVFEFLYGKQNKTKAVFIVLASCRRTHYILGIDTMFERLIGVLSAQLKAFAFVRPLFVGFYRFQHDSPCTSGCYFAWQPLKRPLLRVRYCSYVTRRADEWGTLFAKGSSLCIDHSLFEREQTAFVCRATFCNVQNQSLRYSEC